MLAKLLACYSQLLWDYQLNAPKNLPSCHWCASESKANHSSLYLSVTGKFQLVIWFPSICCLLSNAGPANKTTSSWELKKLPLTKKTRRLFPPVKICLEHPSWSSWSCSLLSFGAIFSDRRFFRELKKNLKNFLLVWILRLRSRNWASVVDDVGSDFAPDLKEPECVGRRRSTDSRQSD